MKKQPTEQKLRGGYYTPGDVASFLTSWAIRSSTDTVLEPSCGDGAFLEQAVLALKRKNASPEQIAKQIQAIELDAHAAAAARTRLRRLGIPQAAVVSGDFFSWCTRFGSLRFDAVVGNPPFIRYQNFPAEHRKTAFALMRTLGLRPNGLMNAWVPFVSLATSLLNERGRLAMVVPSELLQVSYCAELRRFLSEAFQRVTIITFRKLLFKDAQQEVVLFCGERQTDKSPGIHVAELNDATDLAEELGHLPKGTYKPMDHSSEKWTQYFLSKREIGLLRAMRKNPGLITLGSVASVDVGVVTGLNAFFVLTKDTRSQRKLQGLTDKIVTRSAQLQGIAFRPQDFRHFSEKNIPSHLLSLTACEFKNLPEPARRYIREGEEKGFHLGFKCRTRKPWWVVPSRWVPDGFMLRQIYKYPKITANEAGATCTDTIHRVRMLDGVDARTLASAFTNSLTFAFSEVLGRSYGGGVLELEPTEAEKLPLPLQGAKDLDFEKIDALLQAERIEDALDIVDYELLQKALGLSAAEVRILRGIWQKLMSRRLDRRLSRRPVLDC